ncbi:MAG: aminoglycoside phosphotransferase family protein, partial [Verrucomicrobiaceae bacterium]
MLAVRSGNLKWTGCPRDAGNGKEDPLCRKVLEHFRASPDCPPDWPDDWRPECPPQVRRESTIHQLGSRHWNKVICLKIITRPGRKSPDARQLHAALLHYHARSDHEQGFTVPRPYGCIPELGAVIMEWVEGKTFGELLKKEQFNTRKRHEDIRKVAGWLRWFHSQSDFQPASVADGKQLEVIIKVFEENSGLKPAATAHDPMLRRFIGIAGRHAAVLDEVEVDSAILHGDFKPTNLLFSGKGTVVGIDFLGVRRGPVIQDICRFLIDLDFYRNLVRRSYALSPGSRSNDFEAFLSAYGGQVGRISRPAFVYLYFLSVLSALVHQRKKFKPGARLKVRLAIFRSIANQLVGEILEESRDKQVKRVRFGWLRQPKLPT